MSSLQKVCRSAVRCSDETDRMPDNIVSQNLLVKQLEKYQLKVTATSNGEEAIAGECLRCTIESKH